MTFSEGPEGPERGQSRKGSGLFFLFQDSFFCLPWVPCSGLREHVSPERGQVGSITKSPPTKVFNLEIQGEHCFNVSSLSLVVHNTGCDELVTVYRATDHGEEINIYNEFGVILSDSGRRAFSSSHRSGKSIEECLQAAREASENAHTIQMNFWDSLDEYGQAHRLFGQEILEVGQRSLVSFTTDPKVLKKFGSTVFEAKVPRKMLIEQTLEGAGESEVFLIHGFFGTF